MSYKEVVLNYIKTHDVPCLLRGDIVNELWKCKSDNDVYELIRRINYRLNVNTCAVRGYGSDHIFMRYGDLIVSDDILKVLNETKNKKK